MKYPLPNQKTLIDIITRDARKIPKFIDGKRIEHHQAFLVMQAIYETISFLAMDMFLSEHCISICRCEIEEDLTKILDEVLLSNVRLYLQTKMVSYLKLSVELECYEAAGNLKKFLN